MTVEADAREALLTELGEVRLRIEAVATTLPDQTDYSRKYHAERARLLVVAIEAIEAQP